MAVSFASPNRLRIAVTVEPNVDAEVAHEIWRKTGRVLCLDGGAGRDDCLPKWVTRTTPPITNAAITISRRPGS
jgi:hypothetical protein